MRGLTLLLAIFVVFIGWSNSAEAALNKKDSLNNFCVSDIYFGGISSYSNLSNIALYEIRKLTARSVLLNTNLTNHHYNSYIGTEACRPYFGFSIGENLTERYNYIYRINFAFSLSNSNHIYAGFYRTDSIPYDTLTSSQTGNVFYVKKMIIDEYNIYYQSNKLIIDVNGIVSTNPLKRFSFYAGLGLSYGIGLSASTEVTHNTFTRYSAPAYYNNSDHNGYFEVETFKNQNGYSFGVYVPLGVQFRIWKTAKFLKRLNIYCEFELEVNTECIPELRKYTGFYPSYRAGWRYNIGKMQ